MVLTGFEILDISLLAILLVVLSYYLYKNRSKLNKEGILYLYKTSWGIKLINFVGKKYKKTLYVLSYVSIIIGYLLMITIVYMFGQTVFSYLTNPAITETIKAPPIAPVIPYFPQLFGLSEFFPAFYGIYFIIAILLVATLHEFSHGIFARRFGIKIKNTGFAFLKFFPAIFGAFVEQDEKQMTKASKFQQMAVLSAGVFANIIVSILFFIILAVFFNLTFSASGMIFHDYSYRGIPVSNITQINNVILENSSYSEVLETLNKTSGENLIIKTMNAEYVGFKDIVQINQKIYLNLYTNSPAINSKIQGIIIRINEEEIKNYKDFKKSLDKYSPGEEITIETKIDEKNKKYNITLEEHPNNASRPYIGIMTMKETKGLKREVQHYLSAFQQATNLNVRSSTYYESDWGKMGIFVYYLFWWIVMINFLVALINMLPLGILDGGRFFYLTIWGITRNEKMAEKSFAFLTYLILFAIIALMVRWLFIFI